METLSDLYPDRVVRIADDSTNRIMDVIRDVHKLDPNTDLDDTVYSLVHQYITEMMETTHEKLHTYLNS